MSYEVDEMLHRALGLVYYITNGKPVDPKLFVSLLPNKEVDMSKMGREFLRRTDADHRQGEHCVRVVPTSYKHNCHECGAVWCDEQPSGDYCPNCYSTTYTTRVDEPYHDEYHSETLP
jgi:hypothetical protein